MVLVIDDLSAVYPELLYYDSFGWFVIVADLLMLVIKG